jgi:phage replication O-like protein O
LETTTFVRVPTYLLEALLRVRLTETGWRIVLWVIRQSYGWNRQTAPYSWYRIARDLSADRGGIVRTGNRLLRAKVLFVREGSLGVQENYREWDNAIFPCERDEHGQLWIPGMDADRRHRTPMTRITASDDDRHRNRCQPSSLFRRAKDSSKERLKTYKEMRPDGTDDLRKRRKPQEEQREYSSAGAARPIPGKYDRLSQN